MNATISLLLTFVMAGTIIVYYWIRRFWDD
jgi:hypothetical protein